MGSAPSEAENENVPPAWLALKTNIPGVGSKPVKWNTPVPSIVKIFAVWTRVLVAMRSNEKPPPPSSKLVTGGRG